MINRNTFGMLASGASLILQILVLTALLPHPAVANERGTAPAPAAAASQKDARVARGQYLVRVGGCHDCHTEGYAEAGGNAPAAGWLTGSTVGFQGPWGVSYPTNLRLSVQKMSESQWLAYARTPRLPPMPWYSLRDMSDEDLRAVYTFIRAIGPTGKPAPMPVGPDAVVTTPFIRFVPQNLPVAAQR